MNFLSFIEVSMSDNDRKLLIVLMVVLVLLFILLGLIGMLVRYTMIQQGKRIDNYVHDPVVYRVVADPEHFRKYGYVVNNRLLYHQAIVPFVIAFLSLLFYIIYATVTKGWGEDYFGHFGTLFFQWDWSDPNNYATIWGITLLAKWPTLASKPAPQASYWASYILVPMWLTAIVYYLVVIQAFIARFILINRRSRSVYEKSLEGYNFYSTMPQTPYPGNLPSQNANLNPMQNPAQNPNYPQQNPFNNNK
jgi:hypothetical protein